MLVLHLHTTVTVMVFRAISGYSLVETGELNFLSQLLREAFQSKKQRNLGIWHLGGGGHQKIKFISVGSIGSTMQNFSFLFKLVQYLAVLVSSMKYYIILYDYLMY